MPYQEPAPRYSKRKPTTILPMLQPRRRNMSPAARRFRCLVDDLQAGFVDAFMRERQDHMLVIGFLMACAALAVVGFVQSIS